MKISKRILTTLVIIFLLLTIISSYGYVNSLVSYKYEVQDFEGRQALDNHQKDILNAIKASKTEGFVFFGLFVLTSFIRLDTPDFNGRIRYY